MMLIPTYLTTKPSEPPQIDYALEQTKINTKNFQVGTHWFYGIIASEFFEFGKVIKLIIFFSPKSLSPRLDLH